MAIYKTGDTAYGKTMALKASQYDALICRAETLRRDNGGKPSKAEAICYRDAVAVCEEIRDMNLSQRAEYNKWDYRAKDCLSLLDAIVRELDPNFGKKPAPAAAEPSEPPAAATTPAEAPVSAAQPAATPAANPAKKKKGTPVTTASGFTTYNSCEEVTAETIEKLYKSQPNHDFNDVTGMEDVKELLKRKIAFRGWQLTAEAVGYRGQNFFFFYGLPGTGKTYVIESFVGELMKKGYHYIQLRGSDVHQKYVGVGEKTIQIAIQEAIDNSPCIIFMDEFDEVCRDRNDSNATANDRKLTVAFLEAYNEIRSNDSQVILIGATNYPNRVDTAMMDRMVPILIPLPDEKSRAEYFERQFKTIARDDELTYEYMADVTDNYSYRDLEKITSFILERVMEDVISSNQVYDEQGNFDQEQSDITASEEIKQGIVKLTKELFDSVNDAYTPSDKTENRACLESFEQRRSKHDQEG